MQRYRMMGMEYEILLGRIMKSDPNIRHCIIADTDGNIKATKHKDGVDNYLSQVETVASLKRACLLYTSPSPRDLSTSRMPSSA